MTMNDCASPKQPVVRLRNAQGLRLRAEAICVKDATENEVLLISTSKGHRWTMPGGGIEPGEDAHSAALREVKEEAGIVGRIIRCLGTYQRDSTTTTVFVLQVDEELREWDEMDRTRKWLAVAQVLALPNLKHTYRIECLKQLKSYSPQSDT